MKSDRCVYILFRPDTGLPFYVGQGSIKRPIDHLKPSSLRKASYKNHLLRQFITDGYDIPSVIVRNGLTNEQACETEIALIAAIGRSPRGPLTNATNGGEGVPGLIHTEEWKTAQGIRSRASQTGKRHSDITKERISAAKRGHKPTQTTLEKLSQSQRGQSFHADPAYRAKLSASLKGRLFTPEWRASLKTAWIRRKNERAPREETAG